MNYIKDALLAKRPAFFKAFHFFNKLYLRQKQRYFMIPAFFNTKTVGLFRVMRVFSRFTSIPVNFVRSMARNNILRQLTVNLRISNNHYLNNLFALVIFFCFGILFVFFAVLLFSL